MSNFKYQYGEKGNTYLVIGDGRLKVRWKERFVPKGEEINPAIEIVPKNILLCADNNFKQELNINFYPEGIENELTIDNEITNTNLVDWLDGAEKPTIFLVGKDGVDSCEVIFGVWDEDKGDYVEPYSIANVKVKGFLFNKGLETSITRDGYVYFEISKVYPAELQPGEIEWSIDDPTLGTLEVDPLHIFKCKVSGKGKLGDTVLRLTYKADPSIAGVCIVHFVEPTY